MQETKNLVQEALIQMKQVEEAIAENAKGILHSTMKEEINQLVKESLSEQDDEEEVDLDLDADIDDTDVDTEVDTDVDMDVDNDEMDMDVDTDIDMDSEDESPIDLTDASDEEILKVFKAMGEEDGIIVKKDGNNIHLTDDDADTEYLVKLGESEEDEEINMNEMDEIMNQETDESVQDVIDAIFSKNGDTSEVDMDDVESDDSDTEMDEVVYEIHLDDDDDSEEMDEDDSDMEMDEDDSEEMDEDDSDMEMDEDDSDMEMDEDDSDMDDSDVDESYIREGKSTIKPKGVGIGSGPKFAYKKSAGGFKEDKKQGPKSVGTGKAKFEYKKGGNMEGKSKIVKAETKEGQGYKDKEDERLAMKHGKIASKDLKSTKARRDDAGFEKAETKEAARTYGMGSKEGRGLRKGITNNRNYNYSNSGVKVESTNAEVSMLREKNDEYRKALNVFREKLNEVAIFNSNLAYATRLFTEHSTTKKEKINILRRFDGVETLKESKSLYKSIKDELTKGDTQPITESVETKLNKQVSTGSSVNLIESKTYENPQFLRMKDLMSKLG
jgi:hypothetical protein